MNCGTFDAGTATGDSDTNICWKPHLAEIAYDYFLAKHGGWNVGAAEKELANFAVGLRMSCACACSPIAHLTRPPRPRGLGVTCCCGR
jgi:hypothetical protein